MLIDYIESSLKNIFRNKKNITLIMIISLLFILLFIDAIFMKNYYGYLDYNNLMDIDFRTFAVTRPASEVEEDYSDIKNLEYVSEVYESKYRNTYVASDLNFSGLDGGIELLYGSSNIVPKSIEGKSINNLKSGEMICPYDFYPDPDAFYEKIDENKIISAKKILNQEFNIFFTSHKYEIVNNKVIDNTEEMTKKFKIVGLYDNKLLMKHNNQCYINSQDMKKLIETINQDFSYDENFLDLQVIVDKEKNVKKVMHKLQSLGYQVSDNVNSYFDKKETFVISFLCNSFFVIISGAVLLILINYISKKIKDNSRYLGILRACGYPKKQVIFNQTIDTIIILTISFAISLIISLLSFFALISIFKEKIERFIIFTYFNVSFDFSILILLYSIVIIISIIINYLNLKDSINKCITDLLKEE